MNHTRSRRRHLPLIRVVLVILLLSLAMSVSGVKDKEKEKQKEKEKEEKQKQKQLQKEEKQKEKQEEKEKQKEKKEQKEKEKGKDKKKGPPKIDVPDKPNIPKPGLPLPEPELPAPGKPGPAIPSFLPPGPIKLPGAAVFDVTKHGAIGNGKPNLDLEGDGECLNAIAFIQAWHKACETPGPTKVLIPPGNFVVGQVLFTGPCKSAPIMVENQGTLLANPDLSLYPSAEWILFERVDNVIFTGSGLVNAQGPLNWKKNDCKKNSNCAPLPTSIKLHRANNSIVDGIKSVDSIFFHMFVTVSQNVTIRGVTLTAPDSSPNTDGIHTSQSKHVTITDSVIGTGDDCISIGQGSFDINIANVICGPGHGISIGSLGREDEEQDVRGIHVRNCTFTHTQNGARIKTWPGKVDTVAEEILYEDLVMDFVKNPIIIDTTYTTHATTNEPSHVKLSNIRFKNIRGTSANPMLVSLNCSQAMPCEGITLADINLKAPPEKTGFTTCLNAKVKMEGTNVGIACPK